ncbi:MULTISPECIES: DUF1292 domain-containing protein [Lacrimispora]|jgi:uncharacterized protein YrzB (UPF0473 family)|uniref:DUF1292 domain-containing protein n=1 Tax=Lacrimispora TaxID=2719231 RepID=UPI002402A79E|nr:DUF1292 domain-containing protein [Paenibacillaceae bacterium]MBE5983126.1 DUF1292 domain-containing protein [Paenibacillaceae bacterium]MBE5993686.1 DUF1292 domain-containing protein [Paenibacillaceae bacterium]
MNSEERKITLTNDEGEEIIFYVLEETRINGMNYLLVTDSTDEDEEGECYILKDMSKQNEEEALYEFVEDDNEIDYLFKIFSELLDGADVDIEK